MLPLSICLIGKNESNCITNCLKALKPITDSGAELVFTDTGSTDDTLMLVSRYTSNIYHFTWCDDFSAARNYCASQASNDWILFLDCDETLSQTDPAANLSVIQSFIQEASTGTLGMIRLKSPTTTGSITVDYLGRLYNRKHYTYRGIIHEQLFTTDGSSPVYRKLNLTFHHSGYAEAGQFARKAKRNLTLLKRAYEADPTDTYTLFQIGQAYRSLNQPDEAIIYFDQALSFDVNPELDYVKTLVESYGYTLLDLKRPDKALELLGVYDTFCTRADFVFLMGLIYMNNGLFEQAITEFTKAAQIPAYSVEGVNSYRAYYNIGVIYECLGDYNNAQLYYHKCGDYAPAMERVK